MAFMPNMQQVAEILTKHRKLALCAVALVTMVALTGTGQLGVDESPRNFLRAGDRDTALLDEVYRDFGSDDTDCVFVVESDDLFTPQAVTALRELVSAIRKSPHVISVRSIDEMVIVEQGALPRSVLPEGDAAAEEFAKAKRNALAHPLIGGWMVAKDARTTLVIARLEGDVVNISDLSPAVEELRSIAHQISRASGLTVRLTGIPVIRVEVFELLASESLKFQMWGVLIGGLISIILFRKIAAVVIVTIGPITGMMWTLGAMGFAGQEINLMNAVVPMLVLVIGFTDAIHLMYEVRRARSTGASVVEAGKRAICYLGFACALTSLTTAIGFGSLVAGRMDIIQRFGICCAVGTVLTFLAVITIVPLLTQTRLGRYVGETGHSAIIPALARPVGAMFSKVLDHARMVGIGGIVLTLLLVGTAFKLRPNSFLAEGIPQSSESALALRHCDEVFGGAMLGFVLVEWPESQRPIPQDALAAMAEAQEVLKAEPLMGASLSIRDILAALPWGPEDLASRAWSLPLLPPEILQRFINAERRRALVMYRVSDSGTAAYQPVLEKLDADLLKIEQRHPGITLKSVGTIVLAVRSINGMIGDLARSLGLAAVIIFVVMTLALKSLRLGVICIIPNVFPLAVTAALLVWCGRNLELTSVTVFTISLGIAVDDTIHFLSRFKRELAECGDVRQSIMRSFRAVGVAVLTTTLVLCGGFGACMFSAMPVIRLFGALSCLSLLAALLGDLIILPALLQWFFHPNFKKPAKAESTAEDFELEARAGEPQAI